MNEHPPQLITKETRARNSLARSKTRNLIVEYIYDQTGCEKCKVGHFCSRDGDKWGCLTYGNIASHLNHIGHPTSRGNKWSNKTVRDQVTWGMRKVTEKEKEKRIEDKNKNRNEEVVWETHELTDTTEKMIGELERKFQTTTVEPDQDIEVFLNDLRQEIITSHKRGWSVTVIRRGMPPTS
ncbi:hypothetical protein N9Y97_07920 [Pseudomonadales bacterium]|nr:hypothetical protein [Pseudomonadales bacterium]